MFNSVWTPLPCNATRFSNRARSQSPPGGMHRVRKGDALVWVERRIGGAGAHSTGPARRSSDASLRFQARASQIGAVHARRRARAFESAPAMRDGGAKSRVPCGELIDDRPPERPTWNMSIRLFNSVVSIERLQVAEDDFRPSRRFFA